MANFELFQGKKRGRTFIMIAMTPKSAETRAVLAQIRRGVSNFEKKWQIAKRRAAKHVARRAARGRKKKS